MALPVAVWQVECLYAVVSCNKECGPEPKAGWSLGPGSMSDVAAAQVEGLCAMVGGVEDLVGTAERECGRMQARSHPSLTLISRLGLIMTLRGRSGRRLPSRVRCLTF